MSCKHRIYPDTDRGESFFLCALGGICLPRPNTNCPESMIQKEYKDTRMYNAPVPKDLALMLQKKGFRNDIITKRPDGRIFFKNIPTYADTFDWLHEKGLPVGVVPSKDGTFLSVFRDTVTPSLTWREAADGVIKTALGIPEEKPATPGVDLNYLISRYISSIDETKPTIWTEEHLKELVEDFILIPKK